MSTLPNEPLFDRAIYRLSDRLGKSLKVNGLLISVAESCTGGWIGQALTQVPGSSKYFHTGYVIYANESKSRVLGVPTATHRKFGAVSEQVVCALTNGLLQSEVNCDVAVAVSGVAGPGGSDTHPAGMVWLAWQLRGHPPISQLHHFRGGRHMVRRRTVATALAGAHRIISDELSKDAK